MTVNWNYEPKHGPKQDVVIFERYNYYLILIILQDILISFLSVHFFFVLNTKCQNKSGRLWIRGICCLSAKHMALRRKNGWHGIGIMRQECSDMSIHSELVLYKNPTKCAGLVHHRHHHHLIEMQFVLVIIWLKSYLLGVKQQSLTHSVIFSEKHTSTE